MSALSELLRHANTERDNLSARRIARAAQEHGFTLNHDTAARYLRGDHGRPDEATLVALSKVLNVPLTTLRSAATLPADETEPYRPPAEASRLNRRQRRAVDEIIRAMVQPVTRSAPAADRADTDSADALSAGTRPADASPTVTELDAHRPKRTPKAARRGKLEPPQR